MTKRGTLKTRVATSHTDEHAHQRDGRHDVLGRTRRRARHRAGSRPAKIRPRTSSLARLEARIELHLHRARPRQVDRQHAGDAPGPRRHDHHAVGEQDRLRDAVGDEQDGLAPLVPDAQQLQAHLLARHGVQRAERLVHQEQARIGQQRPADGHALLHAARQLARVLASRSRPGRSAPAGRRPACGTGAGRARASRSRRARCRAPSATAAGPAAGRRSRRRGTGSRTAARAMWMAPRWAA